VPQYILRDLPEGLWKRVKARAERDGWPLRAMMLQLLEDFAVGRVTPGGAPPMPPRRVAVVQLYDRELRIPGAVEGEETETHLIIYGPERRAIGRFSWADFKSWYIIDDLPA
jgi:hypothetical protein